MLKVKKKKKNCEKMCKKMTSSKRLWKEKKYKLEKEMVCDCMIVDNCGNEMLSSIALKNGSFVLKIVWKVCP